MVRFVGPSPTAAAPPVLRCWRCPVVLVSEGRTHLPIPTELRLSAAAAAAAPAISAPAAVPAAIAAAAAAAARTPQVDVHPPKNQLLVQSTAPPREVEGADGKPLLLLETKQAHLLPASLPCGSNHHSVRRTSFVPVLLLLLLLSLDRYR